MILRMIFLCFYVSQNIWNCSLFFLEWMFFYACCSATEIQAFSELTLYNAILRIAKNFLETKENIKISTHPFYHINLDWFSWEWSKKNSKWPTKKNLIFQSRQFSIFHGLVLWLVGLIDAKGIGVADPIWSWGCQT